MSEDRAGVGGARPKTIIILRALGGLGDFLCLVPTLRAIRAAFPDAHVTLIGMPSTRPVASRFKQYLDELLDFPGFPGIPEKQGDPRQILGFLASMQARHADLALQLHGGGSVSNQFALLMGARVTAGFCPAARPASCADHAHFIPFADDVSEVRRNLDLLAHLGIPAQGQELEFPLRPADEDLLESLPEWPRLATSPFACLHPGASLPARRWPPERFAAVGDQLAELGLTVVLTGVEGEREATQAVKRKMSRPALDLTGRTGLGPLAALLSRARLVVTNDTGTSHLTVAVRTPSVVIFSAGSVGLSNPRRWAPLDSRRHPAACAAPDREVEVTEVMRLAEVLIEGKEPRR